MEISAENLYYYKAFVTKVYDGDTVYMDIDLGLSVILKKEKIRLARINAPEVRGEEKEKGEASREFLKKIILGKSVLLQTIKDRKGKYGRYLGDIWIETQNGFENVNDLLVRKGFAEYV